jgi:UDP-3-O-[3-hydroxymyristoyl] N-acetylglucosamine deacetylase
LIRQKTLRRTVECAGVGLHTGEEVGLRIHPARRDAGLSFVREDMNGASLRLKRAKIGRVDHATTLSGRDFEVATVEHLLAALRIMGIDNAVIELDGPEIPIMDGSAAPFVQLIQKAGVRRQPVPRKYLVPSRSIEIHDNDRSIAIYPGDRLRVSYTIDFPGTIVGRQSYSRTLYQKIFIDEIAPARTFCFRRDVEQLRERGLAKGGTLENAIVVDDMGPMTSLRFEDEFVRHKVLDLVGDLALLGMPVLGHVVVNKGGHSLHAKLVDELRVQGRKGLLEPMVLDSGAAIRLRPAVAAATL